MKSTEGDSGRQLALTAGYFAVLTAITAGIFAVINTLLEQSNYLGAGILFVVLLIIIIYLTSRISKLQVAKSIKKLSENLPSWELLYEHNENGQAIFRDVSSLIDAVGKAYPIKVKISRKEGRLEMMEAQWLFVENGIVHASNVDQVSLGPDNSGNYSYFAEPYHYLVIVNSRGHHHASRFLFDGTKKSDTNSNFHMAWYGLVPPTNAQ